MADVQDQTGPQDGPYLDDSLQIAKRIGLFLNPGQQQVADATPRPAPAAAPPAATPAPAPSTPASPAAVTRTGQPSDTTSKSWADYARPMMAKTQQDQAELQRLQTTGPGVNQVKNPFLRGVAKVADVVGSAVAPGLASRIPGTTMHNRELQAIQQGRVSEDVKAEDTASQMAQREADAQRRAAQAEEYAPVTLNAEQATAIGHPELAGEQMNQRTYATMLSGKQKADSAAVIQDKKSTTTEDVTKQNNQTKTGIATQNNQTKTGIATQNNQTKSDIADKKDRTAVDVAKIRHQARAQGGANNPLRQPMIDAATAQVQKIHDQYQWSQDANDGNGGYIDPNNPMKALTPEEFTDLKNQVATKLDKDLAAKKLVPLGVRFNPKDAGAKGGAQSSAPAQAAPTPAKAPAATPAKQQVAIRDGGGAQLTDKALATQYLQKAGGDKDKARQLAQKDNWKF